MIIYEKYGLYNLTGIDNTGNSILHPQTLPKVIMTQQPIISQVRTLFFCAQKHDQSCASKA